MKTNKITLITKCMLLVALFFISGNVFSQGPQDNEYTELEIDRPLNDNYNLEFVVSEDDNVIVVDMEAADNDLIEISVYEIGGRLIYKSAIRPIDEHARTSFNKDLFRNGIYILNVRQKDQMKSKKLRF